MLIGTAEDWGPMHLWLGVDTVTYFRRGTLLYCRPLWGLHHIGLRFRRVQISRGRPLPWRGTDSRDQVFSTTVAVTACWVCLYCWDWGLEWRNFATARPGVRGAGCGGVATYGCCRSLVRVQYIPWTMSTKPFGTHSCPATCRPCHVHLLGLLGTDHAAYQRPGCPGSPQKIFPVLQFRVCLRRFSVCLRSFLCDKSQSGRQDLHHLLIGPVCWGCSEEQGCSS